MLTAAVLQPSQAWAAKPKKPVVGVVVALNGKPQLQREGTAKWETLKMNGFVYENDTIKTGPNEQVAMAIMGGAEFRVNENSTYVMESGGGSRPARMMAKLGQAWTKLLHGRSQVEIRSNLAVCSVRGTEADVDVADRLTVKVYEGFVDVANSQGKQSLSAGQMTQVAAPGAAPQPPRAMGQGDYGTWQNNLKPSDLDKNLNRLNKEAERIRTLELNYKDKEGKDKKVKMKMEKK
ncbi:MAG: FecR domain-containing protein [Elusimicrobia bacterium]|nr:FecR domain-containing protein [Elusimicrobiota bacterium]